MLRRLLKILPFLVFSVFFVAKASASSNPTFKLRILPKDCIFTVLDVGTQTLFFITPKICEPPPPVNTSTNLELPLEQLVTYEDATGKTTFIPPANNNPKVDNISIDSYKIIGSITNTLFYAIGWTLIGLLWALLIFTIAFGLAGFRKFIATLGSVIHR